MTLRPLLSKPKKRRFQVYDLEWVPGNPERAKAAGMKPLELRLIGTFDGKRYKHFFTVSDFLNSVCTGANDGVWFYAHAGGLADLVFIMEYLVDNPKPYIRVSCAFSGSSAIIVRIDKGSKHWYFVDSYWLIRQSLRKIGEWLGFHKGGSAESLDTFYGPIGELIEYNERDCRILYKAIEIFESHILALGGQLEKTVASTAMALFRRKFLHQEIKTSDYANECAYKAYYASRVEPFVAHCTHADYYDVNSSFPYAMTFPCPGNLLDMKKSLADGDMGLARCKIKVPDVSIPPAPYRRKKDGRIYFPTGIWEGWFSDVDLKHLEESGGQILESYEALSFEPFDDIRAYSQTIYEMRRQSQDESFRQVLKILLNSLYGKFGESTHKQRVVINPTADFFDTPEREPGGDEGREMLMPGVHSESVVRKIPHAHVPIAVHITAIARKVLDEYLVKPPRVYYCDTDGFGVPDTFSFETSDALGGLKKEQHIYEGQYAAPKLYAIREEENGVWKIRSKGFSKISYEQFTDLLNHRDVEVQQFGRLRALWRDGQTAPRETTIYKTWRGTMKTKRRMVGDYSEPWNVGELK